MKHQVRYEVIMVMVTSQSLCPKSVTQSEQSSVADQAARMLTKSLLVINIGYLVIVAEPLRDEYERVLHLLREMVYRSQII